MYTEKSPLQGPSDPRPAYVFANPDRVYKKKVRQFQCYICTAFLGLFAIAIIFAVIFNVEDDYIDNDAGLDNGSLLEMSAPGVNADQPGASPLALHKLTSSKSGIADKKTVTKLYTSGMVVNANISRKYGNGSVEEIFKGAPPIYLHIDRFIDPNQWGTNVHLTWSASEKKNTTLAGTYSLSTYDGNVTGEDWKGDFNLEVEFKYSGSFNIVIPKKSYTCSVIFITMKKASSASITEFSVMKKATPVDTEQCTVMLQGSFYERPFYCFLTPWWCSNEKMFYWNGGVELKITIPNKPAVSNSTTNDIPEETVKPQPVLRASQGVMNMPDFVGSKLLEKVMSGWITIQDLDSGVTRTVWNGNLPANITLPLFWNPNATGNAIPDQFSHGAVWSCSVFHSTIKGSFQLPQYTKTGSIKWLKGEFFVQLEPLPVGSLYNTFFPGINYYSPIYFHDSDDPDLDPKLILWSNQYSSPETSDLGLKAYIIALGKHSKNRKSFLWNGQFVAIVKKMY